MVLGFYQPHDMETPRAHQTLSAFASQAATALDYARLVQRLQNGNENGYDAEHIAKRERAFRQMILDTMSDGLVVIDTAGRITFTNRRLARMTGYPDGYLENRHVGELFHPEDRDGSGARPAGRTRHDHALRPAPDYQERPRHPDFDLALAHAHRPDEQPGHHPQRYDRPQGTRAGTGAAHQPVDGPVQGGPGDDLQPLAARGAARHSERRDLGGRSTGRVAVPGQPGES